jgi:outer membrane protein TolC
VSTRIAGLAVVCLPLAVRADVWSVDSCVAIALRNNPRMAIAASGQRVAQQGRREAGAALRPRVSLHGGASYAPLDGYDPALTEGGEYAARLELEQRLYDGGQSRLLGHQADVATQRAKAEAARTVADLEHDVRLAFLDVLAAERRIALLERGLQDLQDYLGTVRLLANGGAVPKTDVSKVEIQWRTEGSDLDDQRTEVRKRPQPPARNSRPSRRHPIRARRLAPHPDATACSE